MASALLVSCPPSTRAAVDIPLHHWTYEAIDRLVALRVIDRAMLIPKPYSRNEAAVYVKRGMERVRANKVRPDGREVIAEPLLYRLMQEFRPELIQLGVLREAPRRSPSTKLGASSGQALRRGSGKAPRRSSGQPGGGVRSQALGVRGERKDHSNTVALSGRPGRSWIDKVRYGGRVDVEGDAFSVGEGTVRFRENRMGEYYPDNVLVQASARGWLEFDDYLALSARPKVTSIEKVLGIGANANDKNFWFQELNAKLTLWNLSFEAGRGSFWWGPGYHGSLLLTDHAFPLDRVALRSEEPFRLPWVLKHLGEWKVNSFLARLERDRDFPRANVFGLRLSLLPTPWLELGANRLTQFGGRGRSQTFPKAVLDSYKGLNPVNLGINEQVSVDFRVSIPNTPYLVPFPSGLQWYGEVGSEDDIEGTTMAVVTGIYIPQVYRKSTTDLRIEYANTDFSNVIGRKSGTWYNHGTYVSGMRQRGFPLGHHMGTDGVDFLVRSTRYLTDNVKLGANFNLQERQKNLPVHEKKREASVDLTWWISNDLEVSLNYTYQRIKNPGQISNINPFQELFAAGVTSINHLVWTTMRYEF